MAKKKPSPPPVPAFFQNHRLLGGLFFAFGFLLYGNSLGHQYALDDAIVIYDNAFTQQGVEGIDDLLRYDTFRGFFKVEGKDKLVAGGRYRPLTPVLFALQTEIFGLQPWVGHLTNCLLYGATATLLFFFLMRLTRNIWATLAATLLYTAHPLHTEAVANIKGADEMVAFLGGIGALHLLLIGWDKKKKILYWSLAAVIFLTGLLSKENAITLVAVAPLMFWYFRKASFGNSLLQALPLLASSIIFLLWRTAVLGPDFGAASAELMNNPFLKLENGAYIPFSLPEKLGVIFFTLWKYLQLLVFPYPLTHDYYPRHIPAMDLSSPLAILGLLLYLALGIWAVMGFVRRQPTTFGVWFYLLTLSIVSNLVFPIGTNMSERFVYMPSLGFVLAIALLVFQQPSRQKISRLLPFALVALLFSGITIWRNQAWKDNLTLFSTDIAVSANSAKLRNALGGELIKDALTLPEGEKRTRQLETAVGHLQEAARIHPGYQNAYLLLGNAHSYLNRFEEALQYYDQALQLNPEYPDALHNRKLTLRAAGRYYGEVKGDLATSLRYLQQAYAEMPEDYETIRLLGVAFGMSGNAGQAIELFAKAAQIRPKDPDAWLNLAAAWYTAGDPAKAAEYEKKAMDIDPKAVEKRRQKK